METLQQAYAGGELDLFALAANWKRYLGVRIGPFLGDTVLEVGAGIGGTTPFLCGAQHRDWCCLEPDPVLCRRIAEKLARGELPSFCRTVQGTTQAPATHLPRFDTLLYIDVLEHIEDDEAELARAGRLLASGGRIVVLAPAHDALFSPFDRAVGHHRRYTQRRFQAICPPTLSIAHMEYLDSAGLLASLVNRLALRQQMPTRRQILVWDRLLVRVSRLTDPMCGRHAGKSVLAVFSGKPAV